MTRSRWRLNRFRAELPSVKKNPARLSIVEVVIYIFKIVVWFRVDHVIKRSCGLKDGASQDMSGPCLVWCPSVFCKWRYNVFNKSRDFTWLPHWWVMQIYGWELLAVCHRHKSYDHKHWDSGDVVFLIFHVTSIEDIFKGLCKFMGGNPSLWVTTLPCLLAIDLVQVEI